VGFEVISHFSIIRLLCFFFTAFFFSPLRLERLCKGRFALVSPSVTSWARVLVSFFRRRLSGLLASFSPNTPMPLLLFPSPLTDSEDKSSGFSSCFCCAFLETLVPFHPFFFSISPKPFLTASFLFTVSLLFRASSVLSPPVSSPPHFYALSVPEWLTWCRTALDFRAGMVLLFFMAGSFSFFTLSTFGDHFSTLLLRLGFTLTFSYQACGMEIPDGFFSGLSYGMTNIFLALVIFFPIGPTPGPPSLTSYFSHSEGRRL